MARTLITRVGKLELRVPHDRQGRFRIEIEQYSCSGAAEQRTALSGPVFWTLTLRNLYSEPIRESARRYCPQV